MVATELGRLFEVGFNAGVLTYIQQNQDKIEHKFGDLYRQDLRQLCFSQMVEMIWHQEDVTSLRDRETVKKWLTFFVQKGFLAGLNFFQEYVGYLGKNQSSKQKLEILYYQCNFYNENSLQTAPKEDIEIFRTQLSQFGDPTLTIGKYTETGEFLRADTLTLLRYGKKTRILSVDLSVFSIRSIQQMIDADEIRTL